MRWRIRESIRRLAPSESRRSLSEAVEIAADTAAVFAHWTRYERFPDFMQSVRRTKRISDRRVLWDVVIAGRQLVWEAHIVAIVPDTCIRWESRWGTRMTGEVRFERLDPKRTRLVVAIDYRPEGLLERIGARLGWVDDCVRRELAAFRQYVEANAEAHVTARVHPMGMRGRRERERGAVREPEGARSASPRRRAGQTEGRQNGRVERLSEWRADSAAPPLPDERRTASGPSR